MQIEELAKDFITAYSSGIKEEIAQKAKIFFKYVNRNEDELRVITHYYATARALYYLLQLDKDQLQLTDEETDSIVRLVYYCLLKNYSTNAEVEPSEIKYADVVGGSELACIAISENLNFLTYRLLTGSLQFMPNYSQMHLLNQLMLFGGIVREAKINNHYHSLDTEITKRFMRLPQELYQKLPINEDLRNLKANCSSVIKTITRGLSMGFKEEETDLIW